MGNVETREALVETLFHGTGTSYDEMVHFATWGRDRQWKKELLSMMEEPKRVLDLASGTGILALGMAELFDCHVTGVELREEYCAEARENAEARGIEDVRFFVSPAEHFTIDEQFDHITSCYIPKYIQHLDVLVGNMVKMLAPGGLMLLQDFAYPSKPMWQTLFDSHFERMRRKAREEAPGWLTMFEGLPEVIRTSTWKEDLAAAMERHGLVDIKTIDQSFGMSAIVSGRQPS
ncbi:MAG: class I SAM-dependent methyltransferase [Proteobacteria bacterium]|nr:class I SAM-dependent methyltransferase [Pseudomonadota bacterium]